jgi:predicted naringenin-chalcone synthase
LTGTAVCGVDRGEGRLRVEAARLHDPAVPGRSAGGSRAALLLGLGTAVPPIRMEQREIAPRLARIWGLAGADLARWRRIVAYGGVRVRHGVMEPQEVWPLSTARRMEAYERHAPPLACAASVRALRAAGAEPGRISDLVVVSCTGFAAPGVDAALIERLELRPDVRRMLVGFQGCFGALIGLRGAIGACCADPAATALVVCVELCSLHLRPDPDPQNLVASALFSDGASAAVVCAPRAMGASGASRPLGRLRLGCSAIVPEGRGWMSWRIGDSGFEMTLSRRLPEELSRHIGTIVGRMHRGVPATYVVHPGGPAILEAIERGLGPGVVPGLDLSRAVLSERGNMSSATVLFVLEEALRREHGLPALLLAFGPGLAVESLPVLLPPSVPPRKRPGERAAS